MLDDRSGEKKSVRLFFEKDDIPVIYGISD